MQIQITHKVSDIKYNNILILDLYTFSTTASIILNKNPIELYSIWGDAEEAFLLQEKLNKNNNYYLLIDDTITKVDEEKYRVNWHPIPIYYKNKLWWKKYSDYKIIYRSQNWTQAINNLYSEKNKLLIWSFVNFNTTVDYIKNNFNEITLFVCWSKWETNSDDLICAKYYEYFLQWNNDENNIYYKELIREMINSKNSWDFFEKYICSIYWDLLWFNLQLNLTPWVIKVSYDKILEKNVYKLTKI